MEEENIVCGITYERTIESSLGDVYLLMLKAMEDAVLQIDAATGETLTADLLLNRAITVAKWFRNNGIGVGDSISVISENRLEFCIAPIAAFFVGAAVAPLNHEYTPHELKHGLKLSKPKAIFCSITNCEKILSLMPDHPHIKHLVLFGKSKVKHKMVTMFEDIIGGVKGGPANEEFQVTPINPDETLATILCSSGTTGLPKGVMITHGNMTSYLEVARLMLTEYEIEQTENEVMIGLVPFFHSMGFMVMCIAILGKKTVVVMSKFQPKLFLESIVKYKIAMLTIPPTVALFLVKHPMVKNYDLSSLTDIRCGAAPLGKDLEAAIKEKLGLEHISQNYGMTETTLGVLLTPRNAHKVGSVGLVAPGMKCKVINDMGKPLGPYQEGQLCFKGPLIMKGYIDENEATVNTIDKDGWLHTGDVGYYDDQKYFFIVDRLKELIKYKGFQVAPAELEALLLTHPSVADAAVVGLEDERVGELPLAFIVLKEKSVTAKELETYVADRVSVQKRLHGGVRFINEIPRNPAGKILRRVLRERAKTFQSKM